MSERMVRRINGEITHLHRLTDEELGIHLFHAAKRLDDAQSDLETLQFELFKRLNPELPFEEPEINSYAEVADTIIERPQAAQLGKTAISGVDL
jgi:hypothetical protein